MMATRLSTNELGETPDQATCYSTPGHVAALPPDPWHLPFFTSLHHHQLHDYGSQKDG